MRLDSLGKPPLLQVVQEPKPLKEGASVSSGQVKQVFETPQESQLTNSNEQGRLGRILEIVNRTRQEKPKKKNQQWEIKKAFSAYMNIELWKTELAPSKTGSTLDIKG